ncbi:hypothetical protein [Tessaracoccus sp.]
MQLIREFDVLVHDMWGLWRRFLPQVGTWLLLGWLVYTACLLASATIGNAYGALGSVVFVLGVTANVVSVIFAIHALKPGLRTVERFIAAGDAAPASAEIPAAVMSSERRIDVAILTVGPVLGVYAVWAIVDGMISDGLVWNTIIRSFWGAGEFSISRSLADLPFYLVLGGVALVARLIYGRLVRRLRSTWWKLPLVFLEGLWVFATFFIVLLGLRALQNWLDERAFWREGLHAWHGFLQWLPDLRLPFDLTLPEALQHASIWVGEQFLPGMWHGIALPLVWLAVTAIVFGWREFRARDLLTATLRERANQMESASSSATRLGAVVSFLTVDLRDKWVPLLHAFRLIWRSGPNVLGAYLVLSTLMEAGSWAFHAILSRAFSADSQENVLRSFNAVDVVQHVVVMSLSVCLYAAAFDRGLADAVGLTDADGFPVSADEAAPMLAGVAGTPLAQGVKVQ